MKDSSPLLSHWHGEVKQLFTRLHGHQQKVLSLFVLGAMRAESIVLSRVAEELMTETQAKAPSIERRLQRFVSNERVAVEAVWQQFLAEVLPFWRGKRSRWCSTSPRLKSMRRWCMWDSCSRHGSCL